MKKDQSTLKKEYFDKLYTKSTDPWDFEKSDYEHRKYEKTIASLPKDRYPSALEVGCSIGVLTQLLAQHCDHLLAIDISERALESARKRLTNQTNVTVKKASIPDSFPAGEYDLVLISEVGYYLSLDDLNLSKELIKSNLNSGGDLMLIHWTHHVDDYPLSGDQVHEVFINDKELSKLSDFKTTDYRLDVFRKN